MQYIFNHIKPVEYISFRRGVNYAISINITRMHRIIQLFNFFFYINYTYTTPLNK